MPAHTSFSDQQELNQAAYILPRRCQLLFSDALSLKIHPPKQPPLLSDSEQKNSSIIRGIWVTTDSFYESVCRLQQSELTREEFESEIQKTLCQTTSLAERYIADIREIDNQTKTISEIRETYREWIRQVYEEYFKMTEIPTVPDDLHDRFNIVEDLAGCVLGTFAE